MNPVIEEEKKSILLDQTNDMDDTFYQLIYNLEDDPNIGQKKISKHKEIIKSMNFKLKNHHDEIYFT